MIHKRDTDCIAYDLSPIIYQSSCTFERHDWQCVSPFWAPRGSPAGMLCLICGSKIWHGVLWLEKERRAPALTPCPAHTYILAHSKKRLSSFLDDAKPFSRSDLFQIIIFLHEISFFREWGAKSWYIRKSDYGGKRKDGNVYVIVLVWYVHTYTNFVQYNTRGLFLRRTLHIFHRGVEPKKRQNRIYRARRIWVGKGRSLWP